MTSETGISDEFEQTAEHVAFDALDLALAVQDVDRAHQLLVAGDAGVGIGQRDAGEAQEAAHQRFDRHDGRTERR